MEVNFSIFPELFQNESTFFMNLSWRQSFKFFKTLFFLKTTKLFSYQLTSRLWRSTASRKAGRKLPIPHHRSHLLRASVVCQQSRRCRVYARVALPRLDRRQSVAVILSNLRLFGGNKNVIYSIFHEGANFIGRACGVFSLLQILFGFCE